MIYFILFLMGVIMFTLIFIASTYNDVLGLYRIETFPQFHMPMIIEHAYRGVDFIYSFQYATEDAYNDIRFYPDHGMKMIVNDEHKKYIMKDATYKLAQDMLEQGFIEVKEYNDYHPYARRVEMKVKVYKPEF